MGKYIVLAFYKHLALNVRVTEYSKKADAYEYIGGLRICETSYLAFDKVKKEIFDICVYDVSKEEMIKYINEM